MAKDPNRYDADSAPIEPQQPAPAQCADLQRKSSNIDPARQDPRQPRQRSSQGEGSKGRETNESPGEKSDPSRESRHVEAPGQVERELPADDQR
jgi:hypothetical protein